ncbi:transcription repressor OFP12-like [Musa acuminata AAA Group]|uniref:transcription repressor OFP12-like n=1 Tax=Musa acuminata AAA Group TaxID=214697 RepID=UPI0031E2D613
MFGESLYRCFSGFRHASHSAPLPASQNAPTSSSSCDSPVVFKNFNSLYDPASDSETLSLTLPSSAVAAAAAGSSFTSSCDAPDDDGGGGGGGSCPSERDLFSAIASRRLLPASPGRSNSIVDSAAVAVGAGTGVPVPTYSPDPYRDFRRSMEEMVVALGLDARDHRAHLHELLLCYLALNRKHAHKYIVSAFADLLLALASTPAVDKA